MYGDAVAEQRSALTLGVPEPIGWPIELLVESTTTAGMWKSRKTPGDVGAPCLPHGVNTYIHVQHEHGSANCDLMYSSTQDALFQDGLAFTTPLLVKCKLNDCWRLGQPAQNPLVRLYFTKANTHFKRVCIKSTIIILDTYTACLQPTFLLSLYLARTHQYNLRNPIKVIPKCQKADTILQTCTLQFVTRLLLSSQFSFSQVCFNRLKKRFNDNVNGKCFLYSQPPVSSSPSLLPPFLPASRKC